MKTLRFAFLFLLGLLALPGSALAAGASSVRAILVIASNEKGGTDGQLAPFEQALREVTRYQSYRVAGQGSASVPEGGRGSINLPAGNSVQLQADGSGVKVIRGGRPVGVERGSPVILLAGTANDKGDRYAIIVTLN